MNSSRLVLSSALLASLLMLAGCGGEDDNSSASNGSSGGNSSQLNGNASDGYLIGALACLDVNENIKCDASEPQATTTAPDGAFVLTVPAGVSTNHPIVVEVSADTIDVDTGNAVGSAYILTAPVGSDFVSPISTMVQDNIRDGLPQDVAEARVRNLLGFASDVSISSDYNEIEADNNDPQQADFARLHRFAQVIAALSADAQTAAEAALAGASVDDADLHELIVDYVEEQLNAVQQQLIIIEGNSDLLTNFNSTEFVDNLPDFDVSDLSVSLLAQALVDDLTQPATGLEALFSDGLFTAFFNANEYGLNSFINNQYSEREYLFNSGISTFQPDDDFNLVLSAIGWIERDPNNYSLSFGESHITATHPTGYSIRTYMEEIDVTGLPMYAFTPTNWQAALSNSGNFPTGSKAYASFFAIQAEHYELLQYKPSNNLACFSNALTAVHLNGNCNVVSRADAPSTAATALSQIMLDYNANDAALLSLSTAEIGINSINEQVIALVLHTVNDTENSGQVGYFTQTSVDGTPSRTLIGTGSWETKIIHGETLLLMSETPTSVRSYLTTPDEHTFLTVQNGFVRKGEFAPAGTVYESNDDDLSYNRTAFEAILGVSAP